MDTKSAQEILEGREKVNQGIVASMHFVDRLGGDRCQGDMQMRSGEDRHTASRIPMPANNAFAGGNGCRIAIRSKVD
jgi:hypothetical protein